MTKKFSLGDVLSITTEHLMSERKMAGVEDILHWMMGDNLFTHRLSRAAEVCAPFLRRQFPALDPGQNPKLLRALGELTELLKSAADKSACVAAWLAQRQAEYGNSFEVAPLRESELSSVGSVSAIESAFGLLSLGKPSTFDGADTAPTRTIFVCASEQSYKALSLAGATPILQDAAIRIYQASMESNMTQFEFHA